MYATKLLSKRGWIVWAGYKNSKKELLNIKNVFPLKIDVTKENQILNARKIIFKSKIPLNVVLNNAGVPLRGPLETLNLKDIKKIYEINFFGLIRVIKIFLPLLRESSGRIINMGSTARLIPVPFTILYSSSKSAVKVLSDILRNELIHQNIKVSIIEPGSIKTPFWEKSTPKKIKLDPKLEKIYGNSVKKFENFLKLYGLSFSPLKVLEKPLIHAVESPHPKKRYITAKYDFLLRIFPRKILNNFLNKVS